MNALDEPIGYRLIHYLAQDQAKKVASRDQRQCRHVRFAVHEAGIKAE